MSKNVWGDSQSGQILLVVVLAAVISLTVGLSVASRVITNTKTTTDEANSQKALSAAEAGVEQQIKSPVVNAAPTPITFGNGSSVVAKNIQLASSRLLINGGNSVNQDDGVDIWLSTYPNYTLPQFNGNIKLYWTDNNTDSSYCTQNAAIEVVVLSGASKASPSVKRYAFDPTCSGTRNDGFTDTSTNTAKQISGITFNHYAVIPVTNGFIARAVPLYAGSKFAIEGFAVGSTVTPQTLPSQGYLIESTGTASNTTRTLRVFQGYPKLPTEYFPYTLFLP